MKLAKKIFVLGLVAFWALVTNHCGLEMISGLKFLACSPQSETERHLPSNCGETDACATIENGLYKTEEAQVSAGKVLLAPVAFALLSNVVARAPGANQASTAAISPELVHTWQFSFRTALPPRAPSGLS